MLLLPLLWACDGAPKESDTTSGTETVEIPADCEATPGNICTWAGTPGVAAFDGGGLHRRLSYFYWPMDIEFSPYGDPVISDWNNHKIRMVQADGTLRTIMGTDFVGDGDTEQADLVAPGVPGDTINLNHPTDAIYYPDGTLLSAGWHTFKFRTWDPATGLAHVYWGSGPGYTGEAGADATGALNNFLKSVVMDDDGNLYFIDQRNERVRMLTTDYTLYTIAGTGDVSYGGDGGPATAAMFHFPKSNQPEPGGALAWSPDKSLLYVCDTENQRIRAINMETGIIETVAGDGTPGFGGDGGPATAAQLNNPRDIEVDADGSIWIADTDNHRIRKVAPDGTITTVAGDGTAAFAGDDGPATAASLYRPFGVSIDEGGHVYIADTYNQTIRVLYR